jgi:hypothetical protein
MNESNKKEIGWLDRTWEIIVKIIGVIIILAGIGIVGFQIFIYLKNGEWIELPLLYLVTYGPNEFVSWLYNPTSWLGLHKIIYGALKLIPLSLCLILVGAAFTAYTVEE